MSEELVLPTVIRNLDLDGIRDRLIAKKGWSRDHADLMIEEYREYLALFYFHPGDELVPPSVDLDDVWHEHILDTQKYSEDCQRVFGRFVHHVPGLEQGTDRHSDGLHRTRRHWWNIFGKRKKQLTFEPNSQGGFDTVVYGGGCTSYMPPSESHGSFFSDLFSGGHSGGGGGGADVGDSGSGDGGGSDGGGSDGGGGGDGGGGCGGGGGD